MDFAKAIIESTRDVFSTMIMMEVNEEEVGGDGMQALIRPNITSMIGLGGDIKGMLAIHCTAGLAQGVTGALLGMDVDDLDDDVKDAIGEIANMIAGNLKVIFAEHGVKLTLALPTSVIGTSFSFGRLRGAAMVVVPFVAEAGRFWLELKYIEL